MSITIMMYHDVRDLKDTFYPNRYLQKSFLRENDFIKQIEFIQKNYSVISIDELESLKNVDNKLKLSVLTFDDGLKDHRKVSDILSTKGLPATFFIPPHPVLTNEMMKTHKIQFIIGETDLKQTTKDILCRFPENQRFSLWKEYSKSTWTDNHWSEEQIFITNFLRKYPKRNIANKICDELFNEWVTEDEENLSKDLYLSIDDIKYIQSNKLFNIGGHGYISENLSGMNVKEQKKDIEKCTSILKKWGIKKLYMSYPNGGFNSETVQIMTKNNYLVAFTTKNQVIYNFDGYSKLELPRLDAAQKIIL